MKIAVLLKQVIDIESEFEDIRDIISNSDENKYIINPYDEYAIEEAIRIKEDIGGDVHISVISIGWQYNPDCFRIALALGVDDAYFVDISPLKDIDSFQKAIILKKVLLGKDVDVVITGKEAVDTISGITPIYVAELLGVPVFIDVIKREIINGKDFRLTTLTDDGIKEVIRVSPPFVMSVRKGINEPRYPSLKAIIKAKRKKINLISLKDLSFSYKDIEKERQVELLSISPNEKKRKHIIIEGRDDREKAEKLYIILKKELKVI